MKKQFLIPENITINNFDLMRFLLALSVILCHSYAIYLGWDSFFRNEPFMKWTGGKISIGSAAVNFFFVISGFLIIRSFEYSEGFWQYLKKRILRIYPGFIVVFFISFFVFGPIGQMKEWSLTSYFDFFQPIPAKREIANMLSLQSPVENKYFTQLPQYGLNNSLWTIQYEFICYLLVPVLGLLGFVRKKAWLLIALFISYVLLSLQSIGYIFPFNENLQGGIISNPYYYPRFFTYFFFGTTVYLYRKFIPRNIWLAILAILLFLAGFKTNLVDIFWPLSGTYLLFYFAYMPKLIFPNFAKHGDLSYGLYLYGWPIQQLTMLFFGNHLGPKSLFLAVLPPVFLFAVFSWKFVENPALKLKNKRFSAPNFESMPDFSLKIK